MTLAALALAALAAAARAQTDSPAMRMDPFRGYDVRRSSGPVVTPLSLAMSLVLDATSWARLQAPASSTAPFSGPSPAQEFARLQRKGYYRSELFQMVVLSLRSGESLDKLVAERDKGARLREMARKRSLDYDALFDEAAALEARATALIPSLTTVSTSTSPPRGQ